MLSVIHKSRTPIMSGDQESPTSKENSRNGVVLPLLFFETLTSLFLFSFSYVLFSLREIDETVELKRGDGVRTRLLPTRIHVHHVLSSTLKVDPW